MAPEAFIDAREKCRKEGYRGWEKADVGDPLPPLFYPLPTRLFVRQQGYTILYVIQKFNLIPLIFLELLRSRR